MIFRGFPTSLRFLGQRGGLPRLRSSLSTQRTSRKSTKTAVSRYAASAKTDRAETSGTERAVTDALTEEFRAQLEAQAKKDAAAGVYNQDGAAAALRAAQMQKAVSPDRDTAIRQASRVLAAGAFQTSGQLTTRLSGLPYTVTVSRSAYRTAAEITDQRGERIASYDSRTGAWRAQTTRAEAQFATAASAIYDEAYRAARTPAAAASGFDQRV